MTDLTKLKELAERATPGRNFDRLPSAGGGLKYTCTGDDDSLVLRVDHKNGEFGFIGPKGEEDEAFFLACTPKAVLELIAEVERLRGQVDHLINQHMPREPIPDMPGYSRVVDAERLVAENEVLRSALQAVQGEVDGNIRPLTRDLVNMVSGVKNGSHPNDIYDHCDEIDRIIDAALEGGGR
ncbi:hypothetical protein [Pseudomonas nitroreducens]|uniref:hypothetical protein n=1 Tax=Pseudomonas nitroreducens TaxID=46680 RepID=UPI00046408F0|nr:hypothetical protein [Pseudomonas nitroreducens]